MVLRKCRPQRHRAAGRTQRRLLVEQLADRRVLAAITGVVFEDLNHSFQQEVGEASLPQRLVYLDNNSNSGLDPGEPFVIAQSDGSFRFDDLADGSYLVRLFNGTQTQTQTIPIEATVEGNSVPVSGGLELETSLDQTLVLTSDSIVIGDLSTGSSAEVSFGSQLTALETLPNGQLLVTGTSASGDTAWVVDPATAVATPIDLADSEGSTEWAQLAIDPNGHGVLLEEGGGPVAVRSIDASDSQLGVQVSVTDTFVPADTQVLASETGNRSVFAWSGSDGLQLALWSNATGTFISQTPIETQATTELLAYDDGAGLLALRTLDGGISVHDVDANFATLHTLAEASGPVTIDGARDLLITISPVDSMLKLINLRDGTLIADLAIDLSDIGQVSSLAMQNEDSVVVLGAAGITEVALRRAAAHQVTISNGEDADPILFGVAITGENSAPVYTEIPQLTVEEDTTLNLAAPTALTGSSDSDGDDFVLIQQTTGENGNASLGIRGAVAYTPDADFFGTDTVRVVLHDGQDISAEMTLEIAVTPTPDSPSGITITIDPISEDVSIGDPVGIIDIVDVDGIDHIISIDDPRLGHQDGEIIVIGGPFDFEQEQSFPVNIVITDPETSDIIERNLSVTVRDANDPITDITPHTGSVFENAPGDVIVELLVHDQDEEQFHTFEVDDERFTVDGFDLRLRNGVSLDFEQEQEIVVNVTATEVPNGGTFTQPITITVRDLPEQPSVLGLTNDTVMEFIAGEIVGSVTIDANTPNSRFELTVDDSRFEIDGTILQLREDVRVERASQQEIQLTVTATDSLNEFSSIEETFLIEVVENPTPFHNVETPHDVDHGGEITALDALAVINYLNSFGPGPVGQGSSALCYDVNADGFVTALDALLVLNEINRRENRESVNGGEEEETGAEGEQPLQSEQLPEGENVNNSFAQSNPQSEYDLNGVPSPSPKLVDASYSSDTTENAIDIPDYLTPGGTQEEFAQSVDETLRLLSKKTS